MNGEKKKFRAIVVSHSLFLPGNKCNAFLTVPEQIDVGKMISESSDDVVFLARFPDDTDKVVDISKLPRMGTLCFISKFVMNGTKEASITINTKERVVIEKFHQLEVGLNLEVEVSFPKQELSQREQGLVKKIAVLVKGLLKEIGRSDGRINGVINTINKESGDDLFAYCDRIADFFVVKQEERRAILEELDLVKRLDLVLKVIKREEDHIRIAHDISNKTRKNMDQTQKEYFLREQLRVIGEELGEDHNEAEDFVKRLEESGAPEETIKKVKKDITRLIKTNPSSPEIGILRNYIETILDLPWVKHSEDETSLKKARATLEEDHYNMSEVKDRIIEHIAVMQLNKELGGQILCLVGPPGVGKTSIAQSVAKALGRKFVRVSLGGVRDESEIRGHRKTYIGSMPGKVISGMKKVGTINPVFLFDEIDKMSHDSHRGDPASAMLEVLDPVQNKTFVDHYLEVAYDLSHVLFICTANDESAIPWALLDRMEIINLSSYTLVEKQKIAMQYLLPRVASEHGISSEIISFENNALEFVIERYTREAGVRELSRVLGSLYRKIAVQIVNNEISKDGKVILDTAKIVEMLGKEKYSKDDLSKADAIGVVNGLSYSAVGGDVLKLEVVLTPGKGELKLTGRLGDVMKESAQIALSVTKSLAKDYGIDSSLFETKDVHIHVPSGAIPKDGPSAGVALVTALVSAFSGKKVRGDTALTGEVTLSGRVLEIGGVREKTLSAYRYGIGNVILPTSNKKSLDKVPEEVVKGLEFSFMSEITEILNWMLV